MIYVFKTSVETKIQLELATQFLDEVLPSDTKWNFDLEDCDNILRVESKIPMPESLLKNNIFTCEELE